MENTVFTISETAISHLTKKDPKVGRLIKKAGIIKREIVPDPFTALVQSIVFQQLAFAAANTIWHRLLSACKTMTPESMMRMSESSLRSCGLSGSKANYVKNIAEAFLKKDLTNEKLLMSSDLDIIRMLIKIKGIGEWTAEMFLIFCLNRSDVFSYKDLGLRKGIMWLYGLENEPSKSFCDALCQVWSPYASVVSLYLWEITIQNYFNTSVNNLLYPEFSNETETLDYFDSPIGSLEIITSSKGLEKVVFCEPPHLKKPPADSKLMETVKTELADYFNGNRTNFDLPIHLSGTSFQQSVWHTLNTIPYGKTKNYGEIAELAGNKEASRAVGDANNKNKIAVIIPCHRVVGKNGSLTGYAGGLDRKTWLLNHEKRFYSR